MRCPYCRHPDSRVVDSREADDGQLIRRRRSCPECGKRFTTVEEAVLAIVKRSGVTEPFSRTKIMAGVRKACQGRPVTDDAIAVLAQKVEDTIRARGTAEVPSHEVGLAILGPLRDLDEVAYLRFASVYRSFESLDDFEREIATLRDAALSRLEANGGEAARSGGAEKTDKTASERSGTTSGKAAAAPAKATAPPAKAPAVDAAGVSRT
jgi:transcriptional repressor NrdR